MSKFILNRDHEWVYKLRLVGKLSNKSFRIKIKFRQFEMRKQQVERHYENKLVKNYRG